jgi:regulator of protease activity HflC (stomatin/prohibitin superfamily)
MSILNRTLGPDEVAVIVQTHGRPPLLVHGPGSVRTFWRWRQMSFVGLKPLTLDISAADIVTKDGVHLGVSGSLNARVVSPVDAVTKVADYSQATRQVTEAALRGVFHERRSTDLAEQRTQVETELLDEVRSAAESWGVLVTELRIRLAPSQADGTERSSANRF